jgi:hypothetical protein
VGVCCHSKTQRNTASTISFPKGTRVPDTVKRTLDVTSYRGDIRSMGGNTLRESLETFIDRGKLRGRWILDRELTSPQEQL